LKNFLKRQFEDPDFWFVYLIIGMVVLFIVAVAASGILDRDDDRRFGETQDDYRKRMIQQCIDEDEFTREECILIVTGGRRP
jgi:uncharacterized membrane protein